MTPRRAAAWARYQAVRVDVLAAGALVALVVDAYEEIAALRERCAELCEGEARLFETYARSAGALPTDAARAEEARHCAGLIRGDA